VLAREVTRHHFDGLGLDSIALHDPLTVAVALDPSLVTVIETEALVETDGEHTRGQTVVDLRRNKRLSPLAVPAKRVCLDVDVERARDAFFTTLGAVVPRPE
jgi:purine nucleosidase